jgi:4-amino-4-deoxy-L-arabinose transferase-like glycosyltransferase
MKAKDARLGLTNPWMPRALAGFIITLFAITNVPWTLDDYDQAKQAYTSFEMVEQGHWLYQHTPNERVATKPPLVGWISAGIFELTGWWDGAWRLPSFAAALVLLWLIGRAAAEAYGHLAGVLALSAFGLNLLSPRLATLVRTDMPLALVTFLIGWQIWNKIRRGEIWTRRDRWLTFALLAVALWIKGPIIYAFIVPGLVIYETVRRHGAWRGERRESFRTGKRAVASSGAGEAEAPPAGFSGAYSCWPWIFSLGLFLAWTIGGIVSQHGFYDDVVLKEFAGRFTETVHKPQPILFYLPHLLHKFAPWSLLLIGLAEVFRRERNGWRLQPGTLWLACWSIGGLIVMSAIPSKRVDRIFPIIPPLCLLLGAQVGAARGREWLRSWLKWTLIFACVFTAGYVAFKIASAKRENAGALVRFSEEVRRLATERAWRYEIVGGREEGMLLYLRRNHFLTQKEAAEKWDTGAIDALVVPDRAPLPALADAQEVLTSEASQALPRYTLLVRVPQNPARQPAAGR